VTGAPTKGPSKRKPYGGSILSSINFVLKSVLNVGSNEFSEEPLSNDAVIAVFYTLCAVVVKPVYCRRSNLETVVELKGVSTAGVIDFRAALSRVNLRLASKSSGEPIPASTQSTFPLDQIEVVRSDGKSDIT
jgi:hypothetical protein